MRALGLLLFAAGAAGGVYATGQMFTRRRPQDVAFAALAPLAFVVALVGLVLAAAPEAWG